MYGMKNNEKPLYAIAATFFERGNFYFYIYKEVVFVLVMAAPFVKYIKISLK